MPYQPIGAIAGLDAGSQATVCASNHMIMHALPLSAARRISTGPGTTAIHRRPRWCWTKDRRPRWCWTKVRLWVRLRRLAPLAVPQVVLVPLAQPLAQPERPLAQPVLAHHRPSHPVRPLAQPVLAHPVRRPLAHPLPQHRPLSHRLQRPHARPLALAQLRPFPHLFLQPFLFRRDQPIALES